MANWTEWMNAGGDEVVTGTTFPTAHNGSVELGFRPSKLYLFGILYGGASTNSITNSLSYVYEDEQVISNRHVYLKYNQEYPTLSSSEITVTISDTGFTYTVPTNSMFSESTPIYFVAVK